MTVFYISNPTQYLNLTTTLLTINKQQEFIEAKVVVNGLLIVWLKLILSDLSFRSNTVFASFSHCCLITIMRNVEVV